jgi:2-polyprenyl-3-methyl-5-hydroxy-6-metoxy-1,4-benzoquinol methylase
MTDIGGQKHWDAWNLERAQEGLVRERRILTDAAVNAVKQLGLANGARLLDIGIGAGWTTEMLHRDFNYLGLDLGEQSVAAAKQRVPDAQLQAIDFLDWHEPSSEFDAVLCVDTIAYFHDQAAAVEKMRRTLKPNGWLVITTVNPFIYSRLSWVGPPAPGQVRQWLSRQQLRELLQQHGFRVTQSLTVCPIGDRGWLRLINARRVNQLMKAITGSGYERLKEALGLGQFQIAVAQKIS